MNFVPVASCIIVVVKATIAKQRAGQSLIKLWNGRGLQWTAVVQGVYMYTNIQTSPRA